MRALALRTLSSSASSALASAPPPVAYSRATSTLHWLMGGSILTCFATVQGAMNTKDNVKKGQLMTIHKSTGLLVAGLLVPRVALAVLARRPGPVPGPSGLLGTLEHFAASSTHLMLYGLMFAMSGTGIAMGVHGGRGLPFYGYTIPGAANPNGAVAKQAYGVHKKAGFFFEMLVPLHVGAAGLHVLRGNNIFSRINPFVAARAAATPVAK